MIILNRLYAGMKVWKDDVLNAFNFSKVSSGQNCNVYSNNYGNSGYVGKAYYRESPKRIRINEYYHINYSNYGFTEYQRVVIHEFGHLHGLDHVDCTAEMMSNNSNKNISQTWLGIGDIAGIADKY